MHFDAHARIDSLCSNEVRLQVTNLYGTLVAIAATVHHVGEETQ